MAWHGAIDSLPAGWVLCDGDNGTPDLRNNFVVCAGDTFVPDEIGGTIIHSHTVDIIGHVHSLPYGTGIASSPSPFDFRHLLDADDSGTAADENHLPPYYAFAFIMFTGIGW